MAIAHRSPAPTTTFTQDERLHWIRELLTGSDESLPYRVAGILLLLYAQPMVKIAALRTDQVSAGDDGLRINLGLEPAPVPEPFADLRRRHIDSRRTQLTGTDTGWLFSSVCTGRHLHPNTMMDRIRSLGICSARAQHLSAPSLPRCHRRSPQKCSDTATQSPTATPNWPHNRGCSTPHSGSSLQLG